MLPHNREYVISSSPLTSAVIIPDAESNLHATSEELCKIEAHHANDEQICSSVKRKRVRSNSTNEYKNGSDDDDNEVMRTYYAQTSHELNRSQYEESDKYTKAQRYGEKEFHEDDQNDHTEQHRSAKRAYDDERIRGKRLFGAVLVTLSQNCQSTPSLQRRAMVERKQQEKLLTLSKECEKLYEERAQERLTLKLDDKLRIKEQCMRQRHVKMLEMAQYLKTKAEPHLYYRSKILTPEEEKCIARQVSQVTRLIDEELKDFEASKNLVTSEPVLPDAHDPMESTDRKSSG